MKIDRHAFDFHDVEKDTVVILYCDKGVPESLDEINSWEELRQAAAFKQADKDGKEETVWKAMTVDDPPFNGRVVFPLESKEGEKSFAIFSLRALDTMCEEHSDNSFATDLAFWPIDSSPVPDSGAYACIVEEMDDIPCVHIISKDRQRAITVASRTLRVLYSVFDKILGADHIKLFAGIEPEDFTERWDLLRERMEVLAITVRTADQAFNALAKYRSYLEDLTGKEKCENGRPN
jgi:hypothetical protein